MSAPRRTLVNPYCDEEKGQSVGVCKDDATRDHLVGAYQVEVALKRAKLLCSKVLGQHNLGEFGHIVDSKRFARSRPSNNLGMASVAAFCFAIQHLIQTAWKLLRYPTLAGAGESKVGQ
jgi:hypothetical protein